MFIELNWTYTHMLMAIHIPQRHPLLYLFFPFPTKKEDNLEKFKAREEKKQGDWTEISRKHFLSRHFYIWNLFLNEIFAES